MKEWRQNLFVSMPNRDWVFASVVLSTVSAYLLAWGLAEE